ncbi:nucleoside diphosphate kinase regulator [Albimonas sp. CAU 1670]|uniref:nucleoside diphosphate kinase regulator n=1 Tax=Albimonas sp. CAU 1670 TaxID=3032599 RepID=UPI0023D9CC8D|nr:nucleoside diphosphate kinase regulator [Albimonas sp. CAU 1670]MDF2233189.1 nucleoside diphosphate kinase regulator [Albimonas sp. CAU 1670]
MDHSTTPRRGGRKPAIVIDARHIPHLDALAHGAAARDPELADQLHAEIDRARVVAAARMPADVVGIGNRVRYRDETTGREQTVSLVWPEESDITAGRVSVMTPIGVALLGLKQGARFDWRRRDGERRTLCVIEVLPAHAGESVG